MSTGGLGHEWPTPTSWKKGEEEEEEYRKIFNMLITILSRLRRELVILTVIDNNMILHNVNIILNKKKCHGRRFGPQNCLGYTTKKIKCIL